MAQDYHHGVRVVEVNEGSFRKLQAENQKLGDRLNYARQRANLLSQELGAMGPPSQRQVVALGRQRLAVQRLEERQKKLQQQTTLVRAELYRAGISAKDDAGATARLARETSRYNQELSKQEARLKRLGEAQRRMNAARASYARSLEVRDRIAGAGATTTAAGLAMGAPVMAAVKSYTSMEDAMKLSIATMQSKSFFEGMNLLKLNPEVIEKQMTKDAMGTIQRVLEKVNALPQDKRLSAMTMLFGKEFGDDAAKLANNLPELQRQLKLTAGNDALGSMQKESDINKDSLSAQWLLVKTGAQNTFSSLGETLRQPLMDILYTVKSVTGALRRWVEANPELTGTLMKASAVVAAVTVGLGTLAVALAAVLGPLAVIRLGFSVLGIKTLSSVTAAVTRTSSALSWLAGAPLALLRRGLASSGNAAGLLTAPLSSLRRTASLTGNVLKTVAGAPVALLRSGLSGLRAVAVMFMNPLAVLRGGLAAAGTVLRVLASGPLAMLRVALYAISGLLPANPRRKKAPR